MSYSITLYNTVFDKDNNNVILFDTQADFISYLNSTANVTMSLQNFDAKNIISTSVTFVVPNNYNLLDILNYNYCKVEGTDTGNTDVLFYWIKHSRQNQGNNIQLELEIDPWGTYIYKMRSSTSSLQGMIQKAHQNRYVKINDKYYYNWNVSSSLFEREDVQGASKRTTARQKLIPQYTSDNSVNTWLEENVLCWVYVWLKQSSFVFNSDYGASVTPDSFKYKSVGSDIDSQLRLVAYPLYKKVNSEVRVIAENSLYHARLTKDGFDTFVTNNGGYANVQAMKLSKVMPFKTGTFTISGNTLTLDTTSATKPFQAYLVDEQTVPPADKNGVLFVRAQNMNDYVTMTVASSFFDNEFATVQNDNEPKLYNEDYSTYHIYIGGQTYDLPVSKTSNKPAFKYYEMLTPDITKFVLTFDSQNSSTSNPYGVNSIFGSNATKDFTGFVGTIDTSLWYAVNGLDEYLATNKNNLQIFQNQQKLERDIATKNAFFGLAGAGVGLATGIGSGNPLAVVGGLISGAQGVSNYLSTSWKQETDAINRELTLDNMRQSPDKVSAINSNAILINALDEFGFYIELQEMIPFEKEQTKDQFKRFGYTYNVIDDVRNFFKTRQYYNYIQADVFDLNIPVSEDVKLIIKAMFAKGVRIWHGDTFTGINFNQINYERSIQ